MEKTTQSFVPIKEVRDGVIIRDDGTYCGIILVSSVNFLLKSTDEQDAIIFAFKNLIDSLEISTQIVIQSRLLNIKPYLEYIKSLEGKQESELMKTQTRSYHDFIEHFTNTVDIVSKRFFVVVSYSPSITGGSILPFGKGRKNKLIDTASFEENRSQLQQRVDFVQTGIRSTGLRGVQLDTEGILELLYLTYNPGETESIEF